MDAHTLELLQFAKVRELIAAEAGSTLGKDLARQALPSTDAEAIRSELALVAELVQILGEGQVPPVAGLSDVRLLIRRAAIGAMLSAEQLLEVAGVLSATGNVYRFRMRLGPQYVRTIQLLAPVEDLGLMAKSIQGCIDARGQVLSMASPDLAQVRLKIAELDDKIQQRLKQLLRDPELRKALRYDHATISGEHFVLPVAVNYRHLVPGVIHRTSSTGETVFVEPAEIAGLGAERVVLKADEQREINKVLRRLSGEVGRLARPLTYALDAMARLDYVTAKAKFARAYGLNCPDLNTEGRLWLRAARHPLLEHLFRTQAPSPPTASPDADRAAAPPRVVVPIDVRLGQHFNLLIVTGPNTGGKTVALKTVGLLCLMAQSGMHIPAAPGSEVPVFRQILADIGDEQSLEQSLSTFSAHMARIAAILRTADAHSLVLLDELGAGTDPVEGAALGRAILDELDRLGCRAMVTTHLGDLKTYAWHNARAENAAVEFDAESLRPTYRLLTGQIGMSNALKIARRLDLPTTLLKRAHRYLRRRQRRSADWRLLQRQREDAERARQQALDAELAARQQRAEYERKMAELERKEKEAEALRAARAQLRPGDPVHVPKFDKQGRIVRVDPRKNLVVVALGLGQWEVALDDVYPLDPARGP
ncbi:MAG: DNA strand exchange inhibitor protein [Gemmataceae bacterium]|nr:DNA strand exchange inhibitor protein [Gemmataceae bacterium]